MYESNYQIEVKEAIKCQQIYVAEVELNMLNH